MQPVLRPHQVEALARLKDALRAGQRRIIVAAPLPAHESAPASTSLYLPFAVANFPGRSMPGILHHRFNLLPETLFLCVNYIDRFLSCKVVSLGKLQLVGATAIFIAAKYEEINCPSVQEIVYMVDGGYTIDEILKAERFMLTMLQFELGWPGPMSFLRRISKADDYDLETRTLAKYFLEVTVMDERFIGSPPSFAAAGSHCLARLMLHKGQWVSNNRVM